MPIFKTPFSRAYWKESLKSFRSIRGMVFAALMVAACIVLSHFSIKVTDVLTVSFSFLARALCSLVYGPIGALVFAAAEDTLSFLLNSKGYPYFPGYLLTTMLGCLTYALFFYRTKVTVLKIFLAKLLTNLQNVLLGALWSSVLYGKGYLYYMTTSAVKNLITLPIYTLFLVVVFQALLPVMQKIGIIPNQLGKGNRITII
ncbi:MAG: folate family ECF transporter S component [Oscillospiraceae bacterium]